MVSEFQAKRPDIIAIVNQKGGVGKTTTAINLAFGLVERGQRVLLLDLDPQGNASTGLGIAPHQRSLTTYDLLLTEASVERAAQQTKVPGLMICPANSDLSSVDIDLAKMRRRSFLLRDALHRQSIESLQLDIILIDCPPSLSLLTVNAMVASDSVLVPLQSEFFALEGLAQLITTVRDVRLTANPGLRIEGVVLTMYDSRNNLSQQVERDARVTLGDLVFKTVIPRNVRLSEAPSFAMSALEYDATCIGSIAYRSLTKEFMERRVVPAPTR